MESLTFPHPTFVLFLCLVSVSQAVTKSWAKVCCNGSIFPF